ncbi:hypothetical protein BGW38_002843 [Lunasporangiospora selenospora]|uniref:Uncharacterized protein n=1 Tax=Lunasporangiospora selenospora TaxID=979761 RepID=A0A9P6KCM1_9FUNG|nr:hypothetical protein BGW38_002843 [Lunasporangiospora selenospora]
MHSSASSQLLNPHSSSAFASYASSIASSPGSRPTSPASTASAVSSVPTPPPAHHYHNSILLPLAGHHHASTPTSGATPPQLISPQAESPVSTPDHLGHPHARSHGRQHSGSLLSLTAALLAQPATRLVLALTIILTVVSLGGRFPDHCTAPSHVLYAEQYPALLASPFIIPLTPTLLVSSQQTIGTAVLLGLSNLLSLSLFEERLATALNGHGSRVFRNLFLALVVSVMAARQLLGFIFSRAFGWQVPWLFFSDSAHECNLGLAPYLFALLPIQFLFPDVSTSSESKSSSYWSIRRTHLQVILCLFNVIPKTIVWWAGSGLAVGFLTVFLISYQQRMGHWGANKAKASTYDKQMWTEDYFAVGDDAGYLTEKTESESDSAASTPISTPYYDPMAAKDRRLSRLFSKAVAAVLPMIIVLLLFLSGCNHLHTVRPDVSTATLATAVESQSRYLLTLVLMTAPRKNGVVYIKETLSSYLDNIPDETVDPLYSRIQFVVYTHFTDFDGYDEAKAYFDTIPKARKHVKWVREQGSEKNHRKHLISAIRHVGTTEDTVYLGIMEDDFPFCAGGWQGMLNLIYEANRQVQGHCGVFIATGGSGLIFKRSVALTASFILENDVKALERGEAVPPPDITLQNCMLGKHEYCQSCEGNMVISKTLLQGHLGYNTSSSGNGYSRTQFQCGWRHPFNGSPVIHAF